MKNISIVFTILVFLFWGCKPSNNNGISDAQLEALEEKILADLTKARETSYDRVTSTGVLRAGYVNYVPACSKNTKTGEMEGIFVDILEEVARNLNLELEWTEEVGWATAIEGLETKRYDIIGSPMWNNPKRARVTTMSIPAYYSGIGVFVRSDDNRFDNNRSLIDSPNVRICTVDGSTTSYIAEQNFPKAAKVTHPEKTQHPQVMLDVALNKCDVFLNETYQGYQYSAKNPGEIKNIASEDAIRYFGNCYMFARNEFQMKHMIDATLEGLISSGFVEGVLQKHEPAPGLFYRVADKHKTPVLE